MKWPLIIRRVSGESMLPVLKPGQIVIGLAFGRLRPGRIVIISHGGMEKIKRVGRIDGDKLYIIGDNAAASTDSRQFGWISRSQLTAVVVWPRAASRLDMLEPESAKGNQDNERDA